MIVTENTRESDQNQGVKGDSVGCSTGIHTSNKCGQYVPRKENTSLSVSHFNGKGGDFVLVNVEDAGDKIELENFTSVGRDASSERNLVGTLKIQMPVELRALGLADKEDLARTCALEELGLDGTRSVGRGGG
jgi:hypothetical protein